MIITATPTLMTKYRLHLPSTSSKPRPRRYCDATVANGQLTLRDTNLPHPFGFLFLAGLKPLLPSLPFCLSSRAPLFSPALDICLPYDCILCNIRSRYMSVEDVYPIIGSKITCLQARFLTRKQNADLTAARSRFVQATKRRFSNVMTKARSFLSSSKLPYG